MKKLICTLLVLLLISSVAFGYELKGYVWGTPLSAVESQLTAKNIKPVYDNSSYTLVFNDVKYGKECKVSLLFTPDSSLLAGAALVWSDSSILREVKSEMIKKYGQAVESEKNRQNRKYYLWYSPTDKYDRVALISDPNATVLGYFGGKFYKQYQQEAEARQ